MPTINYLRVVDYEHVAEKWVKWSEAIGKVSGVVREAYDALPIYQLLKNNLPIIPNRTSTDVIFGGA